MHIKTLRRKNGLSYRAYVKKQGKQICKTFRRKHDAQQWAQEIATQLDTGCRINLRFRVLAEEWIENRSKPNNSASHYLSNLTQLKCVSPVLGEKYIHQISFRDIEALVKHLRQQDPSRKASTINAYIDFVRTVLNYGIQRGDLLRNPVKREHFLVRQEVAYRFWQLEEANTFLAHAEQKYQTKHQHVPLIYNIALNTGMRLGEILALKWDAVFLHGDKPSLTIRRTMCPRTKQLKETTKGKRVRYVGINEVLLKALQEAHKHKTSEFVVTNQAGKMLDERNLVQRHFEDDVKESGVTRIRFHDMRHSFASLYMTQGGSLYDLQKILGHQDLKTTERYAHLGKDHILDKSSVVVIGRRDNVIEGNFQKQNAASGAK